MNDEMRAVIDWLNSKEGRRWSRRRHRQTAHAKRMFSLKYEAGGFAGQGWHDWGRVDMNGDYHPPKDPDEMPGTPDFSDVVPAWFGRDEAAMS